MNLRYSFCTNQLSNQILFIFNLLQDDSYFFEGNTCFDFQIYQLLEENIKSLDNQLLQLDSSAVMAAKLLPQIANQIQVCFFSRFYVIYMSIWNWMCKLEIFNSIYSLLKKLKMIAGIKQLGFKNS